MVNPRWCALKAWTYSFMQQAAAEKQGSGCKQRGVSVSVRGTRASCESQSGMRGNTALHACAPIHYVCVSCHTPSCGSSHIRAHLRVFTTPSGQMNHYSRAMGSGALQGCCHGSECWKEQIFFQYHLQIGRTLTWLPLCVFSDFLYCVSLSTLVWSWCFVELYWSLKTINWGFILWA